MDLIIGPFSLGATAEALRANIDVNSAFLKRVGQLEDVPTNHSSYWKTRCVDLSYGIRIWAEVVLSQFTCLTDGQTDRRLYDR